MRVGVIGLGSIGIGIAHSLRSAGHDVIGVDREPDRRQRFVELGGKASDQLAAAALDRDCVFCVVVNASQTESVLFGEDGAGGIASVMPEGAVFLSCATMAPESARQLGERLELLGRAYLDSLMKLFMSAQNAETASPAISGAPLMSRTAPVSSSLSRMSRSGEKTKSGLWAP